MVVVPRRVIVGLVKLWQLVNYWAIKTPSWTCESPENNMNVSQTNENLTITINASKHIKSPS